MPLNPSGAISLGGPSTGASVALELGLSATATISLNDTVVRTLGGVASGQISLDTFWGKSNTTGTQKAIFGFGIVSPSGSTQLPSSITNLVSSTGVVATDTPGVGTARSSLAAAGYGTDKAIFGYGNFPVFYSMTNLVSNTGVVASDTPGVGTARYNLAAAGYGNDKAIFGYGRAPGTPAATGIVNGYKTNLVSNTGVVASDTPGVGTARDSLAAAGYGGDKAIFGYGVAPTAQNITNLVSNTGVVASDTPGVGTARAQLAAAGYGGDKAIFGYGQVGPTFVSMTNLVSNTGVVATDTPGVGTTRGGLAAASYGGDKAIFGYGRAPGLPTSVSIANANKTNLVSNTGVVASDTPGVGTGRNNVAAAGYSTSP